MGMEQGGGQHGGPPEGGGGGGPAAKITAKALIKNKKIMWKMIFFILNTANLMKFRI